MVSDSLSEKGPCLFLTHVPYRSHQKRGVACLVLAIVRGVLTSCHYFWVLSLFLSRSQKRDDVNFWWCVGQSNILHLDICILIHLYLNQVLSLPLSGSRAGTSARIRCIQASYCGEVLVKRYVLKFVFFRVWIISWFQCPMDPASEEQGSQPKLAQRHHFSKKKPEVSQPV
jgi:hypothetical protein